MLQSTVLKMARAKEFVQSPSMEVVETYVNVNSTRVIVGGEKVNR